jgi:hypothetical protein
MTKARRSLRMARIYSTKALRRTIGLPHLLADMIEAFALRR